MRREAPVAARRPAPGAGCRAGGRSRPPWPCWRRPSCWPTPGAPRAGSSSITWRGAGRWRPWPAAWRGGPAGGRWTSWPGSPSSSGRRRSGTCTSWSTSGSRTGTTSSSSPTRRFVGSVRSWPSARSCRPSTSPTAGCGRRGSRRRGPGPASGCVRRTWPRRRAWACCSWSSPCGDRGPSTLSSGAPSRCWWSRGTTAATRRAPCWGTSPGGATPGSCGCWPEASSSVCCGSCTTPWRRPVGSTRCRGSRSTSSSRCRCPAFWGSPCWRSTATWCTGRSRSWAWRGPRGARGTHPPPGASDRTGARRPGGRPRGPTSRSGAGGPPWRPSRRWPSARRCRRASTGGPSTRSTHRWRRSRA